MATLRIRAAPYFGKDRYCCCYASYSPQIAICLTGKQKPSPDIGVAPLRYGLQLPFASDGKLKAEVSPRTIPRDGGSGAGSRKRRRGAEYPAPQLRRGLTSFPAPASCWPARPQRPARPAQLLPVLRPARRTPGLGRET